LGRRAEKRLLVVATALWAVLRHLTREIQDKFFGTSTAVSCMTLVNHSSRNQNMKHIQTTAKSESPLYKSPAVRRIAERMSNQVGTNVHESSSLHTVRVSSVDMLAKLLRMGIFGLMPIKGADVRIESRDGKQLFNTVKTDTQGRYISQGLQPGVYRVSLVVNGAVKAAIGNTKTKSDQATQLNFDLKPVAAGQASTGQKKGKHMVWMPPSTGTHTGGRWVEVDDSGSEAAGALNVKRASAEALRQQQLQAPVRSGSGAGGQ
jgi:hypothetical protein